MNTEPLIILDASALPTYRSGHIPGAVHAWWQDTMDPNGRVFGTVLKPNTNEPEPQRLRRHLIEDLGVTPDSQIVVYDDARNRWAARIVWTLRFLGYQNAAVLDGGLSAWLGAGGAAEQTWRASIAVNDPPINPRDNWYLTTSELIPLLDETATLLLDVRTEAERMDDIDATIAPGNIPGSVAIPWSDTLTPVGGLRPPGELHELFRAAGVTPDRTIVIYARFGVETAHTWLVLQLLGYPNVLIYDSGWVDWSQNPATPKELITNP